MFMEDELQGEMARVKYAQNATEVCSAVSNALVILRHYRELMQEEGDKDEITNIDEDVMNLSRVKRSAARLVKQGLKHGSSHCPSEHLKTRIASPA